jgi:hypothetical protein
MSMGFKKTTRNLDFADLALGDLCITRFEFSPIATLLGV